MVTHVRAYLFTSLRRMLLDKLDHHSKTDAAISRLSAKEEHEELSYEEIIIRVQHDEELRQKLSQGHGAIDT